MVVDFVSDLKYPSPYYFEQAVLGLFVVPVLESGDGLVEERRGGGVGEADHALHGDGPPVLPALPLPDRQDVALAVSALGVMLLASRRRRLARLLPLLFDADGLRLNSHHCGAPRSYHVLAPGFYLTVPHCQPSTLTNLCSLSGKRCYLVLRKLGTYQ